MMMLVGVTGHPVQAGSTEKPTTGSVEIVIFQAVGDPERLDFELTHPSGTYRKAFGFVDQIELGVVGADEQFVEGCESLAPSDWCAVDAPGDYRVAYSGVPDGFLHRDVCSAVAQSSVYLDGPRGDSVVLSETWPLWMCERELWAPMEFVVEGDELDPASVSYELTDADGQPVSGCQLMETTNQDVGALTMIGVCLGLEDGAYRFTVSHPTLNVEVRCGRGDPNEVVIPAVDDPTQNVSARCRIRQVVEESPIPVPAPAVTLPTTGSSTNAVASGVAALLVVAGLALVAVSGGRRRSWPGRS